MARELTMKTGTGGLSVESTQQACLVQVNLKIFSLKLNFLCVSKKMILNLLCFNETFARWKLLKGPLFIFE